MLRIIIKIIAVILAIIGGVIILTDADYFKNFLMILFGMVWGWFVFTNRFQRFLIWLDLEKEEKP